MADEPGEHDAVALHDDRARVTGAIDGAQLETAWRLRDFAQPLAKPLGLLVEASTVPVERADQLLTDEFGD